MIDRNKVDWFEVALTLEALDADSLLIERLPSGWRVSIEFGDRDVCVTHSEIDAAAEIAIDEAIDKRDNLH